MKINFILFILAIPLSAQALVPQQLTCEGSVHLADKTREGEAREIEVRVQPIPGRNDLIYVGINNHLTQGSLRKGYAVKGKWMPKAVEFRYGKVFSLLIEEKDESFVGHYQYTYTPSRVTLKAELSCTADPDL